MNFSEGIQSYDNIMKAQLNSNRLQTVFVSVSFLLELTKAEEDTKKEIVALDREKVLMDQSLCQEPEFVR